MGPTTRTRNFPLLSTNKRRIHLWLTARIPATLALMLTRRSTGSAGNAFKPLMLTEMDKFLVLNLPPWSMLLLLLGKGLDFLLLSKLLLTVMLSLPRWTRTVMAPSLMMNGYPAS